VEFTDEDGLLAELAGGRLDAAFAELPFGGEPLEWIELLADPCVLAVPDASPLARRATAPTLAEIAELALASPRWRQEHAIVEHFRGAGFDLRFSFQLETSASVLALVASGMASAILPALAVDPVRAGVTVVGLGDLLSPRRLALGWHRDRARGPAFDELVAAARATCARLELERRAGTISTNVSDVVARRALVACDRAAA
jgi:DNA-binding transcriptional LysR family regulator